MNYLQDDLPMKEEELRKNNHLFSKTDSYSFEFSENIERSNVYLDKNKKILLILKKNL